MRFFTKLLLIIGILILGFINQYQKNPVKNLQNLRHLPRVEKNSLSQYEKNVKNLLGAIDESNVGYDGGEIISEIPHSSVSAFHYYLSQYFVIPHVLVNPKDQKYVLVNLSGRKNCINYLQAAKFSGYKQIKIINNCLYLVKKNV